MSMAGSTPNSQLSPSIIRKERRRSSSISSSSCSSWRAASTSRSAMIRETARDRLLQGEQLEGLVLDLLAERVDLAVVLDDLVGQAGVGVEQGVGRQTDGLLDHLGHRDQLVDDGVELVEVGGTHEAHNVRSPEAGGQRAVNAR